MSATKTYAMTFAFLDPRILAETGQSQSAIVRVVRGLVRGSYLDIADLSPAAKTGRLNDSLIEITGSATQGARLKKRATEAGVVCANYCSLCSLRFEPLPSHLYVCPNCGITFRLRSLTDVVTGSFPQVPRRVLAYLDEHGHRFPASRRA